ncbi:abortive infection family protein [Pseudomonas monsensis]
MKRLCSSKSLEGGQQLEGLGALRNRLSDAHGKGKGGVKAAPRHAELAVNLAGSTALFLLATWEAKNGD